MSLLKPHIHSATAFAPATCANVAIGFDILGFAFAELGDTVTLTRREDKLIVFESVKSANPKEELPLDVQQNTASAVIQKLCEKLQITTGFTIEIQKGIPLSSGMGGSAASAVAALVALNAFLINPLSPTELIEYALFGEEVASGQAHADNIVPCLFGGLTLIHSLNPIEIIQLPIPQVYCVLVHPHLYVSTKEARIILQEQLGLRELVQQSANLATFISSLYQENIELMQKTLNDILIEPQRAQFVPGFYEIKEAALNAGALGISFSGSGPTMFAFAKTKQEAQAIMVAMQEQLTLHQIASEGWISQISRNPAAVTHMN